MKLTKYEINKSTIAFTLTAIFLVIFDQATKLHFRKLDYGDTISVIGNFLQFTHVQNPGMAFGIEFGVMKPLLSIFSIVASILLFFLLGKISDFKPWVKIGVALVTAGATGNLIDRVFYGVAFDYAPLLYGMVVDFIQVDIPDVNFLGLHYRYFPIFNIADSCVTVGTVILVLMHKYLPLLNPKPKEDLKEETEGQIKEVENNES